MVQADLDVVQLDLQQLVKDSSTGAPAATIRQDTRTLDADTDTLWLDERAFAHDSAVDTAPSSAG